MAKTSDYPDFKEAQLPAAILKNTRAVERRFWEKLLRVAGRIPFAEEAAATYFCATDPATPGRVKAVLIAALAYFVTPADFVPDFVAGFGFTDDAAVLATVLGLVAGHVKPRHRERARSALGLPEPEEED